MLQSCKCSNSSRFPRFSSPCRHPSRLGRTEADFVWDTDRMGSKYEKLISNDFCNDVEGNWDIGFVVNIMVTFDILNKQKFGKYICQCVN